MTMLSKLLEDYHVTVYCTGRPHCYHSTNVDAAFLEQHGDMHSDWLREHARCTKCRRLGVSMIIRPLWTGPPDLDPRRKQGSFSP